MYGLCDLFYFKNHRFRTPENGGRVGQVSGRASVCSGLRPVGMNLLVGVRGFDRSESLALKYVVFCCNLPVVWGGLAAGCFCAPGR